MSQTVEIVRFRVARENIEPFLAGRRGALDAIRASYPGMQSAHLAQLGEDQWIDIVLWDSKTQALAAAAGAMAIPSFAEWASYIAEVASMEHADVRATHG